jgi:hypothetical protein
MWKSSMAFRCAGVARKHLCGSRSIANRCRGASLSQLHDIPYMHGLDIAFFANGAEIFRGTIGNGAFSKTVPLPNVMNGQVLEIAIETTGFQAPGDARRLGVALRHFCSVSKRDVTHFGSQSPPKA